MRKRLVLTYLAIAGLFLALCAPASADSITFNLNSKISGSTLNAVPTATFEDMTGENAGKVELTLTVTSGIGNSHDYSAIDWLFNFNSEKDLGSLSFIPTSGETASLSTSSNGFQAASIDADFDIKFHWSQDSFTQGENAVYEISYGGGNISVGDFDLTSEGDNSNQYYSALYWHGSEGWVGATVDTLIGDPASPENGTTVPEPSTLILMCGGLLAAAVAKYFARYVMRARIQS